MKRPAEEDPAVIEPERDGAKNSKRLREGPKFAAMALLSFRETGVDSPSLVALPCASQEKLPLHKIGKKTGDRASSVTDDEEDSLPPICTSCAAPRPSCRDEVASSTSTLSKNQTKRRTDVPHLEPSQKLFKKFTGVPPGKPLPPPPGLPKRFMFGKISPLTCTF